MNRVSVFIYIADFVGKLLPTLAVIGVFSMFACVFVLMVSSDSSDKDVESFSWKFVKRSFYTGIACGVLALFIPSQKAMYMIAGSEIGETVVKSEEGKKVIDSLTARIRNEIENYDKSK